MNATMNMSKAPESSGWQAAIANTAQTQGVGGFGNTRPLWAALCVLSVCVVALGASLIHVHTRPDALTAASLAMPFLTPGDTPSTDNSKENKPLSPASQQKFAINNIANKNTSKMPDVRSAAAQPAQSDDAAAKTAPPVLCKSCGTVEAVSPIVREGKGSGVGVVAGGVLGGVVGNQVGNGSGKAAATVLGAIGGGWAGNKIEKNMKKTTSYSVRVLMADGSRRTLEQSSAPMVGSKVTLDGNTMRPV